MFWVCLSSVRYHARQRSRSHILQSRSRDCVVQSRPRAPCRSRPIPSLAHAAASSPSPSHPSCRRPRLLCASTLAPPSPHPITPDAQVSGAAAGRAHHWAPRLLHVAACTTFPMALRSPSPPLDTTPAHALPAASTTCPVDARSSTVTSTQQVCPPFSSPLIWYSGLI